MITTTTSGSLLATSYYGINVYAGSCLLHSVTLHPGTDASSVVVYDTNDSVPLTPIAMTLAGSANSTSISVPFISPVEMNTGLAVHVFGTGATATVTYSPVDRTGVVNIPDADSNAYFIAGSIIDTAVEQPAVTRLIKGLKSNSFYSRYERLYLRSPTSSTASLLDFITLTSGTYVNAPTWSTSGITYNGTSQYQTTAFNPVFSTILSPNNAAMGIYARSFTNQNKRAFSGAADAGSSNPFNMQITPAGSMTYSCTSATNAATGVFSGTSGFFIGSRTAANSSVVYQNGASIGSSATAGSGSMPSAPMNIGSINVNGVAGTFGALQECLVFYASAFTAAEIIILHQLVTDYQTALSRNI